MPVGEERKGGREQRKKGKGKRRDQGEVKDTPQLSALSGQILSEQSEHDEEV